MQPTLPWPWLTTPIFALVALNLAAHYYYVLTVSPGFVEDGPREPGPGILWARRKATHSAAVGVRWSEQGLKVTKASETKCKRCGKMRPEVSSFSFGLVRVAGLTAEIFREGAPLSGLQPLRAQI